MSQITRRERQARRTEQRRERATPKHHVATASMLALLLNELPDGAKVYVHQEGYVAAVLGGKEIAQFHLEGY